MKIQIVILSLLAFILSVSSESDQFHPILTVCKKYENVSSNSTYYTNKDTLLTNLTSLASHYSFSSSSFGSGLNQVNGLYLCRPDIPLKSCQACVDYAINKALWAFCDIKMQALAFFQECMVRYSNHSISATMEAQLYANNTCATASVSDPENFSTLLNPLMEGLITEAISLPAGEIPFAFKNVSFTLFEGLYGMVLCTPDITREECQTCLKTAIDLIPTCGGGIAQYESVFLPSCLLRYDTAPFIFTPTPLSN